MKKKLFLCLIALGFMLTSCTKQRDSYYVKYEVSAIASNGNEPNAYIEILTEDTILSKSIENVFEEIYGPYKYHDNTYLKIKCNDNGPYGWNTTKVNGKIYVAKNEEPFVIKSEIDKILGGNTNCDTCEISYIIDF